MIEISSFKQAARAAGRFLAYCAGRFMRDGAPRTAAALSYSSLLAIVPLFAIVFAVLSAFDAFAQIRLELQQQLFEALLPEAALAVSDHFARFVSNASQMTGAGILGLAVAAVLLLNTITGAFGAIWRVREPRPVALRLLVYWALLTLGPLLLGASISLSSYAFAAVEWTGVEAYAGPLFDLLPFLLAALGFTLLFKVVPNRAVRTRHALAGALVAAFLFEVLKKGFGFYLSHFPTYQVIYGALAALPIFLVWMYLSWAVLLLGAEIAAALPEWRAAEARRAGGQGPGARLALALALLGRLRQGACEGRVLRERDLAQGLPATLDELDQVLRALRRGGYAVRTRRSRWVLSRDLATVTLNDLLRALSLSLEAGGGWPENIAAALGALARAGEEAGRRSLAEILDHTSGETGAEPPLRLGRFA